MATKTRSDVADAGATRRRRDKAVAAKSAGRVQSNAGGFEWNAKTGVVNGNDRRSAQATSCSTSDRANAGNMGALTSDSFISKPSPQRAVEDAGIRAGEIIAYRAWSVLNGKLRSLAAEFDWEPNGIPRWHKWIVSSKTQMDWPPVPYKSPNGVDREMAGFHAFKSMRDVEFEYPPCDTDDAVVYGQVKLWGTVYEHQYGYRAEYAKVHTLMEYRSLRRYHDVHEILKSLREAYGIEA